MRIWFVHQYALAPDSPGGCRHFVLAKALRNHGHEVVIVAAGRHYQTGRDAVEYDGNGEWSGQVDGVTFLRLKTPAHRGNSPRRGLNLLSFGWRACRSPTLRHSPPPDLVLGSSPQPFAALAARWLARRHRARFVYEVRDLWPQTLIDGGGLRPWSPVALVFRVIERICLRSCDSVVTVLPAARPYLEANGAAPDKIQIVPNGVDLGASPPPRQPEPSPTFRFMYAGAFGWSNGLDLLLDAMAIVEGTPAGRTIELVLMGDGAEASALRRRAAGLGLRRVRFADPVPKALVPDRLAEASALVMILRDSPVFRWGVSPNKLFDYFAAARPVLYAVRAGNNPVAEAGGGLTADPRDPAAIAAAMIRLASVGWPERVAMGERARRYVERHHDLTRIADAWAGSLTDGASSSPPSRPMPSGEPASGPDDATDRPPPRSPGGPRWSPGSADSR